MNTHPVIYEMLMELERNEVRRNARQAWIWTDLDRPRSLSVAAKVFKRAKNCAAPASMPCCSCC